MKRGFVLLGGLLIIILALSVVQISVSNMLSTGGIELAQAQSSIYSLQKENAILEQQIYSLASLTNIAQKAEKLGYVEGVTATTLVIASPQALAIKP